LLPYLRHDSPFPDIRLALEEPNGLLAAGADLSKARLVSAYRQGIFPWYSEGEPILWWSPNPRTVFLLSDFSAPRSLRRWTRKNDLTVTLNQAFERVVVECAQPRKNQEGTWITDDITSAYVNLHLAGYAHSLEVWQGLDLVGGIYGVSIGKLFCGESMFSRISNGSKLALSCLIGYIKQWDFPMLDCQVENPHLINLGAINLERDRYLDNVKHTIDQPVPNDLWQTRTLDIGSLI
jgi:leucyl/phenylalanyl-tRNA--protein transferase